MNETTPPATFPEAVSSPPRASGWLWLLPVAALAAGTWLLVSEFARQGVPVTIRFEQGHGLKAGDAVKYRGIEVGAVRSVGLDETLRYVVVEARLLPSAQALARSGSSFWIVRPQLDLTGPRGLETVVGANYIAVSPGQGDPAARFTGLEEPPRFAAQVDGGLEIRLLSPSAERLSPGAPVTYRAVRIGALTAVRLAAHRRGVEVFASIEPDYRDLIVDGTRFWKSGGARLSAGWLSGIELDVGPMSSLMLGGVSLATPPDGGGPVSNGHLFPLHDQPEKAWLEWSPAPAGGPPRPDR